MTAKTPVVIRPFGSDWHGEGCACGLCGGTGKSYGAAVFDADEVRSFGGEHYNCDPCLVAWAASDGSAAHNARLEAEKSGLSVLDDAAFDVFCRSTEEASHV